MKLEKFLTFVTHHNESIIQWLFFGILLLAGMLIARSLFGHKEENGVRAADGDLHSALEKILAQTAKLESLSLEKSSAPSGGVPEALVSALKADLALREKELTELKAKSGGADSAPAVGLSERIKELETKLSEYEVLEDDIADLSLYKEENTRLKDELNRVKSGTPAAAEAAGPSASAVSEPETAPEPVPPPSAPADPSLVDSLKNDDIVAEFAQAVEQKPESPVATGKIEVPDTGDPMADFEKLVGERAPVTEDAVKTAPPPPGPPVAAQSEADDLFAEFSQPNTPEAGPAALDTDKMMAEMAALVSIEPATGNALEESIDTEKMAAEATSFGKA